MLKCTAILIQTTELLLLACVYCVYRYFHLPSQVRARCVRSRNFFDFQYKDCGNKNAYHVYNGKQARNNATNHKFHRHIIRIEWLIIRCSRVWFALEMRYFCIRIDLNDASQRPIQSLSRSNWKREVKAKAIFFINILLNGVLIEFKHNKICAQI